MLLEKIGQICVNILCTVSPLPKIAPFFAEILCGAPNHQRPGYIMRALIPADESEPWHSHQEKYDHSHGRHDEANQETLGAVSLVLLLCCYLSSCYPKDPWDDLTYIYLHFSLHGSKGRSRYRKDGS